MEIGDKVTSTIITSVNGLPHSHYGRIMTVEKLEGSTHVIVSLDGLIVNHPVYNNRHRYEISDLIPAAQTDEGRK